MGLFTRNQHPEIISSQYFRQQVFYLVRVKKRTEFGSHIWKWVDAYGQVVSVEFPLIDSAYRCFGDWMEPTATDDEALGENTLFGKFGS